MREVAWLLALSAAGGFGYWAWSWRRRRAERKRAADERMASFMAQAMVAANAGRNPAPPAVDAGAVAKQRLLLEAAAKAAEAGEPVLSIQLYARLLSRYPDSGFAAQARAAVEVQKKKLAKA